MQFSVFFECMTPWANSHSKILSSYILFLNITDNISGINKGVKYKNDKSESPYDVIPPQRYYKYTKGMPINTIAHKIRNHINKEKFIDFLKKEAYNKNIKKSLLTNFKEKKCEFKKEHLFEKEDKLYEDIADAFIEIINDAADEYKNSSRNKTKNENDATVTNATTQQKDVDSNDINHGVDEKSMDDELSGIPDKRLSQINDYIMELLLHLDSLLKTGKALAKEVNRNSMSTLYKNCSNWEPLHKEYKNYTEKNTKLHTYFEKYKCKVFEQVAEFNKPFTIDSFWRCNYMRRTRSLDTRGKIKEYMQKLSEISSAIENFKEYTSTT